jgi:hypothetical protein
VLTERVWAVPGHVQRSAELCGCCDYAMRHYQ